MKEYFVFINKSATKRKVLKTYRNGVIKDIYFDESAIKHRNQILRDRKHRPDTDETDFVRNPDFEIMYRASLNVSI